MELFQLKDFISVFLCKINLFLLQKQIVYKNNTPELHYPEALLFSLTAYRLFGVETGSLLTYIAEIILKTEN